MRFFFSLLFLSTSLTTWAQLPAGFVQRRLAQDLNPTAMTFAPDGRLFIVEKNGRVRIVQDDVLQPEPFMTLPNVEKPASCTIEVNSILGKLMHHRWVSVNVGQSDALLNVADWPTGTYLAIVRPENGRSTSIRRLLIR